MRRRVRLRQAKGNSAILGIFDSGLGGLTVLRQVREQLPQEDIVYLADQAHLPYGDRSIDDLTALLARNVAMLESAGVDAIVMGCNTSCAVAAQRGWPDTRVPILDLIDSTTDAIAMTGTPARIGVIATTATARSGAYGNAIRRRFPAAHVQEIGAPELVPLIEEGQRAGSEVERAVARACRPLERPLEALVLACTHYPLLDAVFAKVLGPNVHRIDPARRQAAKAVQFACGREAGHTRYLTTGDVAVFHRSLSSILQCPIAAADVAPAALLVHRA